MGKYHNICNQHCILGEGPVWDDREGLLWWTDITAEIIYTYSHSIGGQPPSISKVIEGKKVGSFALNRGGGLVCACLDGLHLWTPQGGFKLIASKLDGKQLQFNDAVADARGRFIAGTRYFSIDENVEPEPGGLYRVELDGTIRQIDEGIRLSNGLGFSPDSSVLYYTDSLEHVIYKYDYNIAAGTVSNRRIFVSVAEEEGLPDGLTVDSEGYVWSAHWGGDYILRYDPDGKVERKLPAPEKMTTSLAFGGRNLTELYFTSAADFVPNSDEVSGGHVYRLSIDIQGQIEHRADINIQESAGGEIV